MTAAGESVHFTLNAHSAQVLPGLYRAHRGIAVAIAVDEEDGGSSGVEDEFRGEAV